MKNHFSCAFMTLAENLHEKDNSIPSETKFSSVSFPVGSVCGKGMRVEYFAFILFIIACIICIIWAAV